MTTTPVRPRIGVCVLPEYPWRQAQQIWRHVERMGADHGWTYDHLIWGGLPEAPWHSTFPFLTAAALVTERLPLGTFVASPNFRPPALLAKDAITLDDVSGGRAILGVGAGGNTDARLLGTALTSAERTRRFAEFVPLLNRLLTEDGVEHEGEFYRIDGANSRPGCVQQPRVPLLVAANGPKAIRLAAEHGDGWITTGPQPGSAPEVGDDPAAQVEQWWHGVARSADLLTTAEAETRGGRPPLRRYLSLDSAGPPVLSSSAFAAEQLARAAKLGFTDVIVHWPRPEPPYQGDVAVLEGLFA